MWWEEIDTTIWDEIISTDEDPYETSDGHEE